MAAAEGSATHPDDIAVIIGTRPEAIKLASLVLRLGDHAQVIHTGQHYDVAMWRDVIGDLDQVEVAASFEIGARSRGEQIGKATSELTRHFEQSRPRGVIVQGDTNSTLAGALAASTLDIPVIHVEAGLRSHDRKMPEEVNRVLVDAIADLCCAPIAANAAQLRSEGVVEDRILISGNTLAETLPGLLPRPGEQRAILDRFGLRPDEYALSTIHRADLTADPDRLAAAVSAIAQLAEQVRVVLPLHPRTKAAIAKWGLQDRLAGVSVLAPLGPREFLTLEAYAGLLISDSGGVQEEACLFRRPLVVLRDSTERPELLDGWCRLVGDADPATVIMQAWGEQREWLEGLQSRPLPYSTAAASQTIVAEIDRRWPAIQ